ncbi:MAG TPA: sterol desaturase family protein [Byssovorax sp.]|jgi:sterol desaturase/sphingolipid hydroxylase (fatty acid hydroxylase superfamily)
MLRYVLAVLGSLAIGAALFSFVEARWPALPGPRWWRRRGLGADVTWWCFNASVGRAMTEASVVVAVAMAALALGAPTGDGATRAWIEARPTWVTTLPAPLAFVLMLLVGDLLGYWTHRALHARPLWRVHVVHHATRELDWLSASRNHPLNEIVTRLFQVVPLFLLGFRGKPVAAVAPVFALYAVALHANVSWDFGPLRYVLASPRFHRWHHADDPALRDKNFANLFPIWDLMFGTFHMPRGAQPTSFGVRDRTPTSLVGELVSPFRREPQPAAQHQPLNRAGSR